MNIRRTATVFLVGLFVFTLGAVSADDDDYKKDRKTSVSDNTMNSVQSEGFSLVSKDSTPAGVQARPLGELELAIQEYLMYFSAYRDAQQSTNASERSKAPQLLRSYRTAYAKALKMMRDDKLIHPMIPQNPLKFYMDTAKDAILGDPKARRRVYKEIREAIKKALKDGKSADDIIALIKAKIEAANLNWQQSSSGSDSQTDGKPPIIQSTPSGGSPGTPLLPPPGTPPGKP